MHQNMKALQKSVIQTLHKVAQPMGFIAGSPKLLVNQ